MNLALSICRLIHFTLVRRDIDAFPDLIHPRSRQETASTERQTDAL